MSMIINPMLLDGGGFSPSDISGLNVWIDPERDALANNALVSSLTNWGNGGNTISSAGGLRPTYKTAISNGLAAILFSGAQSLTISGTLANPNTVFGVFNFTSVSGTQRLTYGTIGWSMINSGELQVGFASGSIGYSPAIWTAGGAFAAVGVRTSNTIGRRVYRNLTVSSASNDSGAYTSLKIGALFDVTQFFQGHLAELLMYSAGLTDAEMDDVIGYLMTKHGI